MPQAFGCPRPRLCRPGRSCRLQNHSAPTAPSFGPPASLMVTPSSGRELLETTCRLANTLKRHGVRRGDRVAIYMPVSPLAVASMLACARIGAVHTVVFAGFSAESLAGRINDGEPACGPWAGGGQRLLVGSAGPGPQRSEQGQTLINTRTP